MTNTKLDSDDANVKHYFYYAIYLLLFFDTHMIIFYLHTQNKSFQYNIQITDLQTKEELENSFSCGREKL